MADLFFTVILLAFGACGIYLFRSDKGMSVVCFAIFHHIAGKLADRVDIGAPTTFFYHPELYRDALSWAAFVALMIIIVQGVILSFEVSALRSRLEEATK